MASPNIFLTTGDEDERDLHMLDGVSLERAESHFGWNNSFAELNPAEASRALGAPAVRRSVDSDHVSSLGGYYLG